jgi:hypothetical protein
VHLLEGEKSRVSIVLKVSLAINIEERTIGSIAGTSAGKPRRPSFLVSRVETLVTDVVSELGIQHGLILGEGRSMIPTEYWYL